ncbi:MAG: sulfatase-like hydrolase/transferase [Bryobacterales bacterium]|nr:sulfatase-like hydrolase/transferase [Bryobacterales bacterium]
MTRRSFLLTAGVASAYQPQRPPNIVFLYTDDQARWSLRSLGNKDAHTPNMDRIGSEGALFERAFVSTPVCSASRAAMFTSQHSFRTRIHDFIDRRREPELGLSADFPTWPEFLQQHGYRTALFGKWHLGTKPEHHPTRRGFHEFLGFLDGGNRPINPYLEVNGKDQTVKGSLPDILTDGAIDFVKRHRGAPFALNVHFRAPHGPYLPVPETDSARFKGIAPELPTHPALNREWAAENLRAYYSSIASVDRNIGRLLDTLDSLSLAGNTVVVFTSDNGYMIGHHNASGKGNATRAGRASRERVPNMWDDSLLTPLMIRWPGAVKPGTRIGQMISHLDFFPSFLRMAGAAERVPTGYIPCGRDFTPLLRGQSIPWRDTLFADYDIYHYIRDSMRMIRTGDWKLITHTHSDVQHELYDLRNDPGETRNLIGEYEHVRHMAALRRRLYAWQQWMGDPAALPLDKPV